MKTTTEPKLTVTTSDDTIASHPAGQVSTAVLAADICQVHRAEFRNQRWPPRWPSRKH